MKQFIIRDVPEELHRELKKAAIDKGMTLQDFVVSILAEYADTNRREGEK